MSVDARAALSKLAIKLGYETLPADITTFVKDDYFLGRSIGRTIYPVWMEALQDIFPNPLYSPYHLLLLGGAIGLGKTTIGAVILLYDLYRLLCMRDPSMAAPGLMPGSQIIFAIFNATKDLAGDVTYEKVASMMSTSPYFMERWMEARRRQRKQEHIVKAVFPKNLSIALGSRFTHALGQNVFSAILDEANFGDVVANQVRNNFHSLYKRMKSRFMQKGGLLPGHFIVISSAREEDSFLEELKEKYGSEPQTKVLEFPIWEVKKHLGIYSGKTFKVFIGDRGKKPFIIDEQSEKLIGDVIPPERVIEVPIEFRKDFETYIYDALRDIAGIPIGSHRRFIPSLSAILNSMTMPSPAPTGSPIYLRQEEDLWTYIDADTLLRNVNPDYPLYVHLDPAIRQDGYGVALAQVIGTKEVERREAGGEKVTVELPIVATPLAMMVARHKSELYLPIYKIREFVVWLRDSLGLPIAKVTADQFQSAETLQLLASVGFKTELLSVDRKRDPYETLRAALLEGRLRLVKYPLLEAELGHLIDAGKKIDHPEEGSKDVADAVCGAVYSASVDWLTAAPVATARIASALAAYKVASSPRERLYKLVIGRR